MISPKATLRQPTFHHSSTNVLYQYSGLFLIQLGYKVFAYSVKLQCELVILNRLLEFANRTRRLDTMNTPAELSSALQREWDSTLEHVFGSSACQDSVVTTHTMGTQVGITKIDDDPSKTQKKRIGP